MVGLQIEKNWFGTPSGARMYGKIIWYGLELGKEGPRFVFPESYAGRSFVMQSILGGAYVHQGQIDLSSEVALIPRHTSSGLRTKTPGPYRDQWSSDVKFSTVGSLAEQLLQSVHQLVFGDPSPNRLKSTRPEDNYTGFDMHGLTIDWDHVNTDWERLQYLNPDWRGVEVQQAREDFDTRAREAWGL